MLEQEAHTIIIQKITVGSDCIHQANYLRLILRSQTWEYLSCLADFRSWPNYPVGLLTCERTPKTPERRLKTLKKIAAEADALARSWTRSDLIPLFPSLETCYKMANPISCMAMRYLSCTPTPTLGPLLTAAAIECSMYKATTLHRTPQSRRRSTPSVFVAIQDPSMGIPLLRRILHNVLSALASARTTSVIV